MFPYETPIRFHRVILFNFWYILYGMHMGFFLLCFYTKNTPCFCFYTMYFSHMRTLYSKVMIYLYTTSKLKFKWVLYDMFGKVLPHFNINWVRPFLVLLQSHILLIHITDPGLCLHCPALLIELHDLLYLFTFTRSINFYKVRTKCMCVFILTKSNTKN